MFATATDRVRAEIENRIVDGSLAPGASLDEAQLSEAFAVSRTPVREALLQLSTQGFIRIVPRSGIYVAQLSVQELTAMFEVLAYAEGLCAKLVVERITPEQLKTLSQVHKTGKKAVASRNLDAFATYNKAFHEGFYNSCGNAYLVNQILLTRKRVNPYRLQEADYSERIAISWLEHDSLLQAVLQQNPDAAQNEAIQHVFSGGRSYSELAAESPQNLAIGAAAHAPRHHGNADMPLLFKSGVEASVKLDSLIL
ncbi:MAG TPA: GntR family transcriptional regulator [Eoetvoesiella sp.]